MKKIFLGVIGLFICLLSLTISSCKKELSYERPATIPFVSAWSFKQDTAHIGTFDSVSISKSAGVYNLVFVSGPSTNLNQSIELTVGGNLVAGSTYKSSTGVVQFIYYQSGFPFYTSVPLDVLNEFSLVISTISDSTITGTFSGKVRDASLNMKDITEGKFSAKVKSNIAPTPTAVDYYPMTQTSWWSYDASVGGILIPDTAKLIVNGTKSINANLYNRFLLPQNGLIDADSFFYRKSGNDYNEYCDVSSYSALFDFDTQVFGDILFLKENAAVGTAWQSTEFVGIAGGLSTKLRYNFTIDQVNTTLTVNGVTYNNVITVKYTTNINILNTTYNTIENGQLSFAKGIGLIQRKNSQAGTNADLAGFNIRKYQVN